MGLDGEWHTTNKATIWRWREAYQHDFAARMDWTIKSYEEANHPPVPVLAHPEYFEAKPGKCVMSLGTIHIILAVTDNGSPSLTRYKRVIIDVKE